MNVYRTIMKALAAFVTLTSTCIASARASGTTPTICTTTDLALMDVGDDLDALWVGIEVPTTGKRLGTHPTIPLTFNAPVNALALQHALTLVGQVPTNGGQQLPCTAGTAGLPFTPHVVTPYYAPVEAAWGMTSTALGVQVYPRNFSVFVFGALSGLGSVAGPVAAQGSVSFAGMSIDYDVPNSVAIISGASVQATAGAILGGIDYTTTINVDSSTYVAGAISQASPIDFAAAKAQLRTMSSAIGEYAVNGTTNVTPWGGVLLTGTDPIRNVFLVGAQALGTATFLQIQVPQNSVAIVNASDTAVSLANCGISIQGADTQHVLWNMPNAKTVSISNTGFPSSLLAPSAAVTFVNSDVQGTIVAESLTASSTSIEYSPFVGFDGLVYTTNPIVVPPAQLFAGCEYTLALAQTPLTAPGACLSAPLNLPFFVVTRDEPRFQREIKNLRRDLSTGKALGFTIRDGINSDVQEMFARYADAIGLDPTDALLPLTPHAQQDPFDPMLTVEYYQQYHNGIPVVGFGERVHDNDGIARRVTGRLAQGLSVPTQPTIDATAATNTAISKTITGIPPWQMPGTTLKPPTATLIVAADSTNKISQTAKLLWLVDFSQSGPTAVRQISVDATTGTIVDEVPAYLADYTYNTVCPGIDPSSAHVGLDIKTDVTDPRFGALHVVVRPMTDGVNPTDKNYALDSVSPLFLSTFTSSTGSLFPGGGATGATDGGTDPGTNPTPADIVCSADNTFSLNTLAARLHWILQESADFWTASKLPFTLPDNTVTTWKGIDGVNLSHLYANLVTVRTRADLLAMPRGCSQGCYHYDTALDIDTVTVADFQNKGQPDRAVTPEAMGHEFAHGVARAATNATLTYSGESASIEEGFADSMGAIFSLVYRFPPPGNYPEADFGCGGNDNSCVRDLAAPKLGADEYTALHAGRLWEPHRPDTYQGQYYRNPPDMNAGDAGVDAGDAGMGTTDVACDAEVPCGECNDNCGAHNNSTIVGHWFYLLVYGGRGENDFKCAYDLTPLTPNSADTFAWQSASRMAQGIALGGLQTAVVSPNFQDYREATIAFAEKNYSSAIAKQVQAAWDAVHVANDGLTTSPEFNGGGDVNPRGVVITFQPNSIGLNTSNYYVQLTPLSSAGLPLTPLPEVLCELVVDATSGTMVAKCDSQNLAPMTTYKWRARADTEPAYSACDAPFTFTTSDERTSLVDATYDSAAAKGMVVTDWWGHVTLTFPDFQWQDEIASPYAQGFNPEVTVHVSNVPGAGCLNLDGAGASAAGMAWDWGLDGISSEGFQFPLRSYIENEGQTVQLGPDHVYYVSAAVAYWTVAPGMVTDDAGDRAASQLVQPTMGACTEYAFYFYDMDRPTPLDPGTSQHLNIPPTLDTSSGNVCFAWEDNSNENVSSYELLIYKVNVPGSGTPGPAEKLVYKAEVTPQLSPPSGAYKSEPDVSYYVVPTNSLPTTGGLYSWSVAAVSDGLWYGQPEVVNAQALGALNWGGPGALEYYVQLPAPQLTYPLSQAGNLPAEGNWTHITWNKVEGAVRYSVDIWRDQEDKPFLHVLTPDDTPEVTSFMPPGENDRVSEERAQGTLSVPLVYCYQVTALSQGFFDWLPGIPSTKTCFAETPVVLTIKEPTSKDFDPNKASFVVTISANAPPAWYEMGFFTFDKAGKDIGAAMPVTGAATTLLCVEGESAPECKSAALPVPADGVLSFTQARLTPPAGQNGDWDLGVCAMVPSQKTWATMLVANTPHEGVVRPCAGVRLTNPTCGRAGQPCCTSNSVPWCRDGNGTCNTKVAPPSCCLPTCGANQCGSDGCGGTCPHTCGANETCENGTCTCVPKCGLDQCGPDGCGHECPHTCGTGTLCLGGHCSPGTCAGGQCPPCTPYCGPQQCGPDGCGGECPHTCQNGTVCQGGLCECAPGDVDCGDGMCCLSGEVCGPSFCCPYDRAIACPNLTCVANQWECP